MSTLMGALTEVFLGDKTFDFRVLSWRQFLHGARRSAGREHLDDHRIELKCRLRQAVFEGSISVGEDPVEDLGNLDFTVELRGAQKIFAEFETSNPGSEVGKDMVGVLMYHAPIPGDRLAGLPQRVIDQSKTGSVTGWIFYGNDSLREISRLLTIRPILDIQLWVTVGATAQAKPLSLIYQTKIHHPTSYLWTAKENPLEIKEARFVVSRPEKAFGDVPPDSE